jgi:hypothetical protein
VCWGKLQLARRITSFTNIGIAVTFITISFCKIHKVTLRGGHFTARDEPAKTRVRSTNPFNREGLPPELGYLEFLVLIANLIHTSNQCVGKKRKQT